MRFLCLCAFVVLLPLLQAWAQIPDHLPDGAKVRVNSVLKLRVPAEQGGAAVEVSITDPFGQTIWSGQTSRDHVEVLARDWADGVYKVVFEPAGALSFRVDTEHVDGVRARCGLMLRTLEPMRSADGLAPDRLKGVSNLLQRIVTLFVFVSSDQDLGNHLYHCEHHLGFRTAVATARILGSGASEYTGYDSPYFPGLRERSSMFVPPDVVCDFAANGLRKLKRWGYKPEQINHLFITHSHADHFDTEAILAFAKVREDAGAASPLTVHSGNTVCDELERSLGSINDAGSPIKLVRLRPLQTVQAGDLEVTPVRATHSMESDPLCFILRYRGTTLYWGTDTGYPNAETFAALAKERFDVFAHELTIASADDGVTHCDIGDVQMLIDKLRKAGAIDTWTRVVSIHQSPQGTHALPDYAEWQRIIGMECSYDGMPLPVAFKIDDPVK